MELNMEMDDENRMQILSILNTWWEEEHIPMEMLEARAVMIFQKEIPTNLKIIDPSHY